MNYADRVSFRDLVVLGSRLKLYGYWPTYSIMREGRSKPGRMRCHRLLWNARVAHKKSKRRRGST